MKCNHALLLGRILSSSLETETGQSPPFFPVPELQLGNHHKG